MRVPRWILALPVLAALVLTAVYHPRLPDTVASHFNAAGQPDGWAPKGHFLALFLGVLTFLTLLFWAIAAFIDKIPVGLLNLPRKAHWLAPERREATYDFLRCELVTFAFITQVFLLGIFQLTVDANLVDGGRLSGGWFWVLFGGYIACTLVWLTRFLVRFLRT